MKTDREMNAAALAEGYVCVDGVWYRKEYCTPREQRSLMKLEAENEQLPEDVRYDSAGMRWYRLVPETMDRDALNDVMLRRMARDLRLVKGICADILGVLIAFGIAAALYVIFNAREALG